MKKAEDTDLEEKIKGARLSFAINIARGLFFVIFAAVLLDYFLVIKPNNKKEVIIEYIQTEANQTTSNEFINNRVVKLENLFETKSNFLKEVEHYKSKSKVEKEIEKRFEDLEDLDTEKREYFLNN